MFGGQPCKSDISAGPTRQNAAIETKLLELAKGDDLTDAHAFIGVKSLLDGDRKNAIVHFQWDREHGGHSRIAHQLARVEYARL